MPIDERGLEPFWAELTRLGVLGWPYETSLAMARLVLSGVMERHPELDIIVHHAGAMIPFFSTRIASRYPEREDLGRIDKPVLQGPVMDGFRRFYVDTALHGPVSALMSALDFSGADHILMGTDTPFGPSGGHDFCRWGSTVIDEMPISDREKEMIRAENARALCRID
jgi:aminocarboxymuconate-semialdehyde decarboxylase